MGEAPNLPRYLWWTMLLLIALGDDDTTAWPASRHHRHLAVLLPSHDGKLTLIFLYSAA